MPNSLPPRFRVPKVGVGLQEFPCLTGEIGSVSARKVAHFLYREGIRWSAGDTSLALDQSDPADVPLADLLNDWRRAGAGKGLACLDEQDIRESAGGHFDRGGFADATLALTFHDNRRTAFLRLNPTAGFPYIAGQQKFFGGQAGNDCGDPACGLGSAGLPLRCSAGRQGEISILATNFGDPGGPSETFTSRFADGLAEFSDFA
jgi:hypothetical protein